MYGSAVQLAQRLHLEVVAVDPREPFSPHVRLDVFGDVLREVVGVLEAIV